MIKESCLRLVFDTEGVQGGSAERMVGPTRAFVRLAIWATYVSRFSITTNVGCVPLADPDLASKLQPQLDNFLFHPQT